MSDERFFEDVAVGESTSTGTYEMTAEEIVAFGEAYDPQPMHTDPDAATASAFGGLIASGWHTAAATMRLLVDGPLGDERIVGAAGVDELRFLEPVRPGDALSVETEVLASEPWDDARGLVRSAVTTTREDGTTVLSMVALVLYERRGEQ
ncbi:MAG: MaoC family dehydratase [Haloarculaceae archaeon]